VSQIILKHPSLSSVFLLLRRPYCGANKVYQCKRGVKEIVELHYEDVLAILEDDDQARLSGFGNLYLPHMSQSTGRKPIIGATLRLKVRRPFARLNNLRH
jgi:nucleoid DNA-binding protein